MVGLDYGDHGLKGTDEQQNITPTTPEMISEEKLRMSYFLSLPPPIPHLPLSLLLYTNTFRGEFEVI